MLCVPPSARFSSAKGGSSIAPGTPANAGRIRSRWSRSSNSFSPIPNAPSARREAWRLRTKRISDMASAAGTLGIITCGGELPIAIAEAVSARGGEVYLLAINGIAQPDGVAPFKHDWVSLGEFGKALKLLKAAGCAEITMAGDITRPRWD